MKKFLNLVARALALSACIPTIAIAAVHDRVEQESRAQLQGELMLMAQADSQRAARGREHKRPMRHEDLSAQWSDYEHKKEKRHADLGKFAHMYRQPAWPVHAQLGRQDQSISVDFKYAVATNGFNNAGARGDVAQIGFTDGDIKLKDILLASQLVDKGVATHLNDFVIDKVAAAGVVRLPGMTDSLTLVNNVAGKPNNAYLGYFADKKITLDGERERMEAGFNAVRYFFQHRIGLGVFVPLVQDKRTLRANMDWSVEDIARDEGAFLVGAAGRFGGGNVRTVESTAGRQQPFNFRYGNSTQAFLGDMFKAKGFDALGGTSAGVGDVQLYAQARLDSRYLDHALFNARVVLPTAPQAATNKLWAPERGNGGFYQAGMSIAAAGTYNRYFNPHYFMEGLFTFPGNSKQRVPKKVEIKQGMTSIQMKDANVPFGYRLDNINVAGAAAGSVVYNGYDAQVRGLSDTVSTLRLAKGLAFDIRIGNVFEQVFIRHAFLDVYYHLKMKASDKVYGLPESDYNISSYVDNSELREHRIGGEWRWQVNPHSTIRFGIEQVITGKNVAQETQFSAGLNYSF
jgi:hypothetical protein